jgi:uncharacterized membrane protein
VIGSLLLFFVHGSGWADGYVYTTIDYPGAYETRVYGINDAGEIVGSYYDAIKEKWRGFLYDGATYTTIDAPGTDITYLSGINNTGTIVGILQQGDNVQGFLYDGTTYTSICDLCRAWDVNDADVVVGDYRDTFFHGFLYDGTNFITIDYPEAGDTAIIGINNEGIVVGWYYPYGSSVPQGFLYDGTTYTTINFPGADWTKLYDINNVGVIVGSYWDNVKEIIQSFVYDGSSYITLDVPDATFHTYALSINNAGWVSGWYQDSAYRAHGFLATPEPVSSILFLTGAGVLVGRRYLKKRRQYRT